MKLNNYWRINIFLITVFIGLATNAQHSWVYLTDKCDTGEDYFATAVCKEYIAQLKQNGATVTGTSKWLNAVCVPTTDVNKLVALACVAHIAPLAQYRRNEERIHEDFSYGQGDWQLEMLHLDAYHTLGYTGKGVTLGIFDGGFWKVDSLPIFNTFWAKNQIKATYDFVDNDTLRYDESTHGMQVLALAGINYTDSMVGAAPDANFVLARTEDTYSEKHIEELNWLKAMEWADSIGVDIIHSSLGYSLFDDLQGNYSYQDMDGKSTIITIAAEAASKRGIFITNSAGNSGDDPWFHITAPCDGKSVLCIGAVDSFEVITDFSSRGPTADNRFKPDVVAMGRNNTIPNADGILERGSGTSFSGPLIAGMVACLKQAHPDKSNAQLFEAILLSSNRYTAPNNAYGFGLPDVLIADSILKEMPLSGVDRPTSLELSIHPNPTQDYFKIKTEPGAELHITNLQGQVVLAKTLHNWINFVNVNDLVIGTYVVHVMYGGKVGVQKVVIEQ
ncbi:MAG: S8 family peptidase [Bacteroidia bacterium]|jgi:serine protease AprX|nr:S8 family peptidase [Bacteroidia bacterium]